jgi:hypothetical protein
MNITYTYTPAWKQIIIAPKLVKGMIPTVKREMLESAGTVVANEAVRVAHVITGRTKGSINLSIPSTDSITITAKFGAFYEEKRGGQHALLHIGMTKGRKELPKIIQSYMLDAIDSAFQGSTTIKKRRTLTYVRKYMNAQTGRTQYQYSRTYSGGAGNRMKGFGTQRFPVGT